MEKRIDVRRKGEGEEKGESLRGTSRKNSCVLLYAKPRDERKRNHKLGRSRGLGGPPQSASRLGSI